MKKILSLLLSIFVVVNCLGDGPTPLHKAVLQDDLDAAGNGIKNNSYLSFMANETACNIIILSDSKGTTGNGWPVNTNWPSILKQLPFCTNAHIYNFSIVSEPADYYDSTFNSSAVTFPNFNSPSFDQPSGTYTPHTIGHSTTGIPTYVLIDLGTNGYNGISTEANWQTHMQSIWTKCHTDGDIIVNLALLPAGNTSGSNAAGNYQDNRRLWNTWLATQHATSGAGWDYYIDLTADFLNGAADTGNPITSTNPMYADLLHESLVGRNRIATAFNAKLSSIAAFPFYSVYPFSPQGVPDYWLSPLIANMNQPAYFNFTPTSTTDALNANSMSVYAGGQQTWFDFVTNYPGNGSSTRTWRWFYGQNIGGPLRLNYLPDSTNATYVNWNTNGTMGIADSGSVCDINGNYTATISSTLGIIAINPSGPHKEATLAFGDRYFGTDEKLFAFRSRPDDAGEFELDSYTAGVSNGSSMTVASNGGVTFPKGVVLSVPLGIGSGGIGTTNVSQNTIFGGPTFGSGSPSFRTLVQADLPSITNTGMAPMAANTVKMNNTGSSATPTDVTTANAFTAFYETVATTLGDLVYGGSSGAPNRLAGSTSASTVVLSQTGNGSVSAAPVWSNAPAISGANIVTLNGTNITSGTVADARLSANIPLLNATQTWTGADNDHNGAIRIYGGQDPFSNGGGDLQILSNGQGGGLYFDSFGTTRAWSLYYQKNANRMVLYNSPAFSGTLSPLWFIDDATGTFDITDVANANVGPFHSGDSMTVGGSLGIWSRNLAGPHSEAHLDFGDVFYGTGSKQFAFRNRQNDVGEFELDSYTAGVSNGATLSVSNIGALTIGVAAPVISTATANTLAKFDSNKKLVPAFAGDDYAPPITGFTPGDVFTTDGIGDWQQLTFGDNIPYPNSASANLTGRTAAVSSVCAYTPSANGTYRVGAYLQVTAIAVDTITVQVTYTDINSNAQTASFFAMGSTTAALGATGDVQFPTMDIRAKSGTAITVKTILTVGGSITYDVGANIQQIY